MIIPIDKEKILNEFEEKYVNKRFWEEVPKIYERFNNNKDSILEEIIRSFKNACSEAIKFQDEGLKGKIQFIYISYLRTSILESKGIYRIDLYDDKWFLDKKECIINISFDFIYESLFSHISELEEKRKEYERNITIMDIERIKLKEADKYHNLTIEILQKIIDKFLECDEYKAMKKHEEIMILAGEFRDEAILLYKNKPEDS